MHDLFFLIINHQVISIRVTRTTMNSVILSCLFFLGMYDSDQMMGRYTIIFDVLALVSAANGISCIICDSVTNSGCSASYVSGSGTSTAGYTSCYVSSIVSVFFYIYFMILNELENGIHVVLWSLRFWLCYSWWLFVDLYLHTLIK